MYLFELELASNLLPSYLSFSKHWGDGNLELGVPLGDCRRTKFEWAE